QKSQKLCLGDLHPAFEFLVMVVAHQELGETSILCPGIFSAGLACRERAHQRLDGDIRLAPFPRTPTDHTHHPAIGSENAPELFKGAVNLEPVKCSPHADEVDRVCWES